MSFGAKDGPALERRARDRDCTIYYPQPYELLLDIDDIEAKGGQLVVIGQLALRVDFLNALHPDGVKFRLYRDWPSNSGDGHHLVYRMFKHNKREMAWELYTQAGYTEKLMYQMFLGSDPNKELFSYWEYNRSGWQANVLFRPLSALE